MPTISQLTAVSSVTDTDQVPVYSTDNGDARKASLSVIKTYILTNANFTDATFTDAVLITPDLGTPSAGDLINCIGLPLATGVTGVLGLVNGGSGASTANGARSNLGAAESGANTDITSLAGLTTPLSADQGGTGLSDPGAAGNILTSNGTDWESTAPAASGLAAAQTKTANYTAVAGDVLACNTITTGAFSITLPALPVAGQKPIIIFDSGTTDVVNGFATNNLTVLRNGSTINTLADDVVFSTKGVSVIFEYIAGTWRMRIG